jgi:hypothetical protein
LPWAGAPADSPALVRPLGKRLTQVIHWRLGDDEFVLPRVGTVNLFDQFNFDFELILKTLAVRRFYPSRIVPMVERFVGNHSDNRIIKSALFKLNAFEFAGANFFDNGDDLWCDQAILGQSRRSKPPMEKRLAYQRAPMGVSTFLS